MRPSTAEAILRLRTLVGASFLGRLLQRLLALALAEAGICVDVERTVEGPDIDAGRDQIEAKSTEGDTWTLAEKDFADMRSAEASGKRPVLALLSLHSLDGWLFADARGWTDSAWPHFLMA